MTARSDLGIVEGGLLTLLYRIIALLFDVLESYDRTKGSITGLILLVFWLFPYSVSFIMWPP